MQIEWGGRKVLWGHALLCALPDDYQINCICTNDASTGYTRLSPRLGNQDKDWLVSNAYVRKKKIMSTPKILSMSQRLLEIVA